jgi:GxxExxY protein
MYKDLSYKLQGLFFDIRNDLGSGHKESIYQKALEKELTRAGIKFIKEPSIKIYSQKGEFLGLYRPDFIVEDKIIVELKAAQFVTKQESARMYDYLRNSKYELAYLVNFTSPKLYVKRFIFTNDRKDHATKSSQFVAICVLLFVAISGLFAAICGVPGVQAAEISLDSKTKEIGVGGQFEAAIFLNTENEDINAVGGKVVFPETFLKLKEIRDGNSIINFWVDKPRITTNKNTNGNEIMFSGITPGGFNGERGFLFSVIFQAKQEGRGSIEIQDAKFLLNDGLGTPAKITAKTLEFVAIRDGIRDDSWSVPKDAEPPEDFTPEISQDPNIFDGKYFLVFATQDKNSGIDHYEVCEGNRIKCVIAESPYLLQNQKLNQKIFVKAIDKSGNERMTTIEPRYPLKWYERYEIWAIIIIGLVIAYAMRKFLWKIIH